MTQFYSAYLLKLYNLSNFIKSIVFQIFFSDIVTTQNGQEKSKGIRQQKEA
jgi:hypothetical protein